MTNIYTSPAAGDGYVLVHSGSCTLYGFVVVSYTKYNTKYIQIVGTIPAHTTRTVTLPPGCWILTCQDAVFNTKSQLQVSNGTHTAVLPMGVHLLSITALSIAIL